MLAEQRSEPDFLARERLLDRLYPGHPYGRLTATEKGLEALTRDRVAAFAASRFSLAGATLILAGAADPDTLLRACARAFEGFSAGSGAPAAAVPPPPRIDGFSIHLVHRPGSVQTNLLYARPALRRQSPRFPAALAANQSLGGGASSRLFHVLREERGLTYGAYSSLSARVAGGQFGASIDCRTEVTREAFSGLFDLIRAFAVEGPTEEEHERARKYLLGSFPIPRETPGGIVQDEITRLLHASARGRVDHLAGPRGRRVARGRVPGGGGFLRSRDRHSRRGRGREADPARPRVVRRHDALGRGRPPGVDIRADGPGARERTSRCRVLPGPAFPRTRRTLAREIAPPAPPGSFAAASGR